MLCAGFRVTCGVLSVKMSHIVTGFVAFILCASTAWAADQPVDPVGHRALPTDIKQWEGDFDGMIERRVVRVLAPYSRSLYFNDRGRESGISADFVREFERYINQKYAKKLGRRPITVFIVPTTRDKLLQNVANGFGDIAVGNLTATEERKKTVDFFVPPDQFSMNEVVVTGPKSPQINTADDLSGDTVHVRKSSSYYASLTALNDRLKAQGKPVVKLVLVPDSLEDEDMMEMLEIGLLRAIVVDDWKAKMWAQVLKKIKVNEGAVVSSGGNIGWALRKNSPKLREIIAEFYEKSVQKRNPTASRLAQYYRRVKRLKDPTASAEYKRFSATIEIFKKYGKQYNFDPLMLAAQGYQESGLNQQAKSPVGAIGIMQIMPATGADLKVNIHVAEDNIRGGTKYMDILMTQYFKEAKFSEVDRTLFAFAAYNAGPGNIARMRREAEKRGLDQDVWFNNVEIVTAEKIGIETTTYVRNIFKYYVSYRLLLESQEELKKAREAVRH